MRELLHIIKKRLKSRSGFSLAELLMAVAILLLVTVIVATGVPAATRAYTTVKDTANAEVLLSTTMTKLRDEFRMSTGISVTGNQVDYYNNIGSHTRIFKAGETATVPTEIMIQEFVDIEYSDEYDSETSGSATHTLMPHASDGGSLYVTYDEVLYAGNLVKFENLQVKRIRDGKVLVSADEYSIRVLAEIEG